MVWANAVGTAGKIGELVYGLYIDDELTWTFTLIIIIYNKLIKFTGIFYKLRTKLSITWLIAVYFASVYPQILYGIELYANTCPTYLQKLVKLTNKIFRILLNQP